MRKLFIALVIALSATTAVQAQSKVAHINSQKLLDTMPTRKKAIDDLAKIEQSGINELKEMDAAIQKAYADYMAKREGMSPAIREYEEGRITKMQQALEGRQQELDQQFQMLNQEMFKPITERVKKAVEIVSERKKLNYVIEESNTWYYKGGMDITAEVVVELLRLDAEAMKTP